MSTFETRAPPPLFLIVFCQVVVLFCVSLVCFNFNVWNCIRRCGHFDVNLWVARGNCFEAISSTNASRSHIFAIKWFRFVDAAAAATLLPCCVWTHSYANHLWTTFCNAARSMRKSCHILPTRMVAEEHRCKCGTTLWPTAFFAILSFYLPFIRRHYLVLMSETISTLCCRLTQSRLQDGIHNFHCNKFNGSKSFRLRRYR